MDYTEIESFKKRLKKDLKPERYQHTLRTVFAAQELCFNTSADRDRVFVAALLHDCAKYKSPTEKQKKMLGDFLKYDSIIHAPLGAIVAEEEYGICDRTVLDAIKYHTTGRKNMSIEEKIVCLADAIEDGREYPGVEHIRNEAKKSVDCGLIAYFENVISFEKNIHHLTLDAFNYIKNGRE